MTQSFLTIGVTYMIMSAPFFMESFLAITLHPIQRKIHLLLFATGLLHLIAGLLSLLFPGDGWYAVMVLSCLIFCLAIRRIVKQLTVKRKEN